jgi:molecular chaperone HtpG
LFRTSSGEAVKEVRASSRLADSPSVIVSDEDEPSARMRQMMQAMGQKDLPELQPTLEINPDHKIIRKLLADPANGRVEDAAWLLFDQALLLEGVPLRPRHLCPAPEPSANPTSQLVRLNQSI